MNLQTYKPTNLYCFCDGGARGNPGPAGVGFVVKDSRGKVLVEKGEYIGKTTNNVAEYMAVIHTLEWIIHHPSSIIHNPSSINFYLDSKLVVNQLNGLFKIKNAKLMELVIQVRGLENQIKGKIVYHHIPREKNKEADRLLNKALDRVL